MLHVICIDMEHNFHLTYHMSLSLFFYYMLDHERSCPGKTATRLCLFQWCIGIECVRFERY